MRGVDLRFVSGQDERPLDRVLQFADVARPGILPQRAQRRTKIVSLEDLGLLAQSCQKMLGQRNDVLPPLAQAAATRSGKPRGGNTDPGEIAFAAPSAAGRRSSRKSRAHPREIRPSCPGAALRRPAENATVLPACSAAIRLLRPGTACRRARRECARAATAPRR